MTPLVLIPGMMCDARMWGGFSAAPRQVIHALPTGHDTVQALAASILEDAPENGAVWTVERTRRNLVSRSGPHTMWAGVACYPAHAFSGETILPRCV